MFSFESRSGWGNIIYIDNINIASTTTVTCTPPAAPVAVSPGTVAGPGSSVSAVTLQWNTAAGAVTYYPRISQCPYGTPNIVWFDTCHAGTSETATLPTGNLYRWNIGAFSQCGNTACESDGNTLYFNIPPVLTVSGNTTFCQGDSVALHTTAGSTVSTATYYWYLNGTLTDSTSTGVFYAKQSGTYTAAISYTCGITGASNSIVVNVVALPATPTISALPGTTNCGPIQLTASSIGCNNCSYNWSNAATTAVITVTATGTYRVTVTSNGCAGLPTSVSVTVNQPPVVSASASSLQVCTGQQVTLTATGNGTLYQWSGSGLQTSTGSIVNAEVSAVGAQVYTVTATLNSCTATASVTVNFNSTVMPTLSILQTPSNPVCSGTTVLFSATATNGGTSPVYRWATNNNQTGSGDSFTLAHVIAGTMVQCWFISNSSCASPDSVYEVVGLQVNAGPVANAGPSVNLPSTSSANLGGNPSASGGAAPYNYLWSPANGLNTDTAANPVVTGIANNTIYSLTVTDANGCIATDTTEVYIIHCTLQAPTVQLNLCDLAAQNLPAISYQWYLQGNIITGATTRFYSASQQGYYFVKVSDTLGCTAQSADVFVNYPACLTTGIEAIDESAAFDIYPNPAGSELTVAFNNTMEGKTQIEVLDLVGQVVYSSSINFAALKYTLNTAILSTGTYLLRVTNGDGKFAVKRFVKM